MKNKKAEVGRLGEDITVRYLIENGYVVRDRNYRRPWGEIDIVAEKGSVLHFIEVKSVSRENIAEMPRGYRPEDNVHPWKLARLRRVIQTYVLHKLQTGRDWQFDVVCVYIDVSKKQARIRRLENIVL